MTIRPAVLTDLPIISDLISQLGYPVRPDALASTFKDMLGDPRHVVLLAEEPEHGIVAMIDLSCRPALRLQGFIGTIEELIVKRGLRDRGIGDRLIQYAKGLAAERGWVRLETVVARKRESNRRSFLFSRGFVAAEAVTYRLGRLEGQQAPPSLYPDHRLPERAKADR
jgi:N-acetylglutamate synthase-like GNAT family acetyltransferase